MKETDFAALGVALMIYFVVGLGAMFVATDVYD